MIAAGAKAVVQTYGSPTVEACYGVYEEAKLLSIGYGCTFVGLTAKKMNYWFRTCGRDDTQGIFFADKVVPLFNGKRLALMHNFTTFAVGVANETIKALNDEIQAGDVKIVYNEGIRPEEQDFTPALTALKNTKPDLFYYTGHFAEGGLIARQSKDLGIECPFVGSNAVINSDFIKTAGDAAIGCLMTTEPMPADLPFIGAKKFLTAFKSEYGAIPDSPWAIYAADAVNTIAFAMEWVGLVNPSNMTDSTLLANVLHSGKVVGDGITGPLSFTREGDRVGVPNMLYIVDKDYKIVLYDANKHSELVDRKN